MSDLISTPEAAPVENAEPVTNEDPAAVEPAPTTLIAEPVADPAAEKWTSKFSETHRDNPLLGKYDSEDSFIEGITNLNKKIGEKNLEPPSEDATPEQISEFHKRIGRPDDLDGYSWQPPTTPDEETGEPVANFEVDEDAFKAAKEKAFEMGFNDKQFGGMMEMYHEQSAAAMEQAQEQQAQEQSTTLDALHAEWGAKYDANMKTVQAAISRFGLGEDIKEAGLGNNLNVIKMFSTLAQHIGEAKLTGDTTPNAGGFKEAIAAIRADPAYKDRSNPRHQELMNRYNQLFEEKHG
tara:strand:+ start:933 stop:1814 length:882 start_codon:yes stop_codon:yes gene_type:complete